jgi:hypothetical protein
MAAEVLRRNAAEPPIEPRSFLRFATQLAGSFDRNALQLSLVASRNWFLFGPSVVQSRDAAVSRVPHSGKLIKQIKAPGTRRILGSQVSGCRVPGAQSFVRIKRAATDTLRALAATIRRDPTVPVACVGPTTDAPDKRPRS